VNVPKDVYFGVWYFICYLLISKHYFSFLDLLLLIVTKSYLSQQSQHQHLLMIWRNAMNIVG
jgi:hypothetical protein